MRSASASRQPNLRPPGINGVTSELPLRKTTPIANTTAPVAIHHPIPPIRPSTSITTPHAGIIRDTVSRKTKLIVRSTKLPPSFAVQVSPDEVTLDGSLPRERYTNQTRMCGSKECDPCAPSLVRLGKLAVRKLLYSLLNPNFEFSR